MSLDSQADEAKGKLESLGYTVPNELIFKVAWTSTDLKPCPQFQQLQQLVWDKKIQAIGFLDRDRLECDSVDRMVFLANCRKNDVEMAVCQGPPFMDGPVGQLVEMGLAVAKQIQVERAQTGARLGLRDRPSKKGLPPTMRATFGMKWVDKKLVPDDNYQHARAVFDIALKGISLMEIVRQLYRMGIPSGTGKSRWQPKTLTGILSNPIYYGRVACGKYERVLPKERRSNTSGKTSARLKPESEWVWLDGLVTHPIITEDQHHRIQERFKLNKQYSPRNAHRFYLLRGLIECQSCGTHYYGVQANGRSPRYLCSTRNNQNLHLEKCPAKSILAESIETDVKLKATNLLEHPTTYLAQIQSRNAAREKTVSVTKEAIADFERKYQDNLAWEQKSARLLSDEAFAKERLLIMTQRTWIRDQIELKQQELTSLNELAIDTDAVKKMADTLKDNIANLTDQEWRTILETLRVKVLAFTTGEWDVQVMLPAMSIACTTS